MYWITRNQMAISVRVRRFRLLDRKHQDQEREDEVPEQQQGADPTPVPSNRFRNQIGLFRNVCVPDQQVLRERDVRPEDR